MPFSIFGEFSAVQLLSGKPYNNTILCLEHFYNWLIETEFQSPSNIRSSPELQEFINKMRHDIYK